MNPLRALLAVCAFAGLLVAGHAKARVVEESFKLPVAVHDAQGKAIEQSIMVTVFSENLPVGRRRPLLVLNHGRAPEAADRLAMGRVRYSEASRWLVAQGFVVAVPTRVGYGVSGGEDVENTGSCRNKNYLPGYAAAAEQVRAVIDFLHERADVRPDRTVVMGQSYGGSTAITVAAMSLPGVTAGINFAGGGGGNPRTQPGRPCAPDRLESMFRHYGTTSRIPTLWIYTENDRFLGSAGPRNWFAAFREAGGVGEFVQLPPFGDDGHRLFVKGSPIWQPIVADFLRRQGFANQEQTP